MNRNAAGLTAIILTILSCSTAMAGTNLLVNGSFDNEEDPLQGWKYKYLLPGESWYHKNHEGVSVVASQDGRKTVLRLYGTKEVVFDVGQGVKVDSQPVKFEYGQRYRLSCYVKSSGPDCRIYVMGWRWKPGVKPYSPPKLEDLRDVYKGQIVRFSGSDHAFGGAKKSWKKGSIDFPQKKYDDMSKLSVKHLKRIHFLSIHVVAIGGTGGELFVDDVHLEKIK